MSAWLRIWKEKMTALFRARDAQKIGGSSMESLPLPQQSKLYRCPGREEEHGFMFWGENREKG